MFDENYSSWFYVLYDYFGGIYIIKEVFWEVVEVFENFLKYCLFYFSVKRGFGYCLLMLYFRVLSKGEIDS